MTAFHFNDAVVKFRAVGRAMKKSRADIIFGKFLRETRGRNSVIGAAAIASAVPAPGTRPAGGVPLQLDDGIIQRINDELNDPKSTLATVFDEALLVARKRLEAAFVAFVASPVYQLYVDSVTLPKYIQLQLERSDSSAGATPGPAGAAGKH